MREKDNNTKKEKKMNERYRLGVNTLLVLDECLAQTKKDRETLSILGKIISSTSAKLNKEIKEANRFCLRFLFGFLAFSVFAGIGFRFILWN